MASVKGKKVLHLRQPSWVFIDWANVYGWKETLKKEVNPKRLFKYLKKYDEIENINFYFGTDKNPKSKEFLRGIRKVGYGVSTKPVKYIFTGEINSQRLYRRKCDFDMEICIDVHNVLEKGVESFVFLTGDGDFAPLYKLLVKKKRQVIVVYMPGHLGREVWDMKKGIFKVELENLMEV